MAALSEEEQRAVRRSTGLEVEEEVAPRVVQAEKFYTEGPPQLRDARLELASWSLTKAKDRLQYARD